jgi:hypothetical protein
MSLLGFDTCQTGQCVGSVLHILENRCGIRACYQGLKELGPQLQPGCSYGSGGKLEKTRLEVKRLISEVRKPVCTQRAASAHRLGSTLVRVLVEMGNFVLGRELLALAERTRLVQHVTRNRCPAMVNVRNGCDISDVSHLFHTKSGKK